MSTEWYPHIFDAVLERHGIGRTRQIFYTVLFLPAELVAELPFAQHPQLRVEGEIAEVPMSGAFVSTGDGRRYIMVSPDLQRKAGVAFGDQVTMRFRVSDQGAVDVPAALASALTRDSAALEAWEALTSGRRRALAHLVGNARSERTRARRVAAILVTITGRPVPPELAVDVGRLAYLFGRRQG